MFSNTIRRRKVTATCTAAAISATLLTACSSDADDSAVPDKLDDDAKVEISFMEAMASGEQKEALEKLTEDFEKEHPNVTVDLQAQPDYGTLRTKIAAQTSAGDTPTIAQMYPDWATGYKESDLLVNLDEKAQESDEYKDFRKGVQDSLKLDDDVYMYPFNKSVMVVYRNQEKVKDAPKTWDDFAEQAKKGSDGDVVALSIDPGSSDGPAGASSVFDVLAESFGDPVFAEDGTPQFDKPGVVKALKYLVDLKKNDALALGTNYPGQTALGNEKGLFDVSTVASLPFTQKAVGDKFELGVSPLPSGPEGVSNSLAGTNIAMFKDADDNEKAAAWEYMEYLASPKAQAYWAKETGYLPVSEKAEKEEPFASYAKENEWVTEAAKQLDSASSLPPQKWVTPASGPLATAIKDAVDNGADPEEALKKAQEDALKLQKENQ